jgi:hypothetical protein
MYSATSSFVSYSPSSLTRALTGSSVGSGVGSVVGSGVGSAVGLTVSAGVGDCDGTGFGFGLHALSPSSENTANITIRYRIIFFISCPQSFLLCPL